MKLGRVREDEIAAKRWLRRLRENAGLSQAALADIVGIRRETIVNAESENEGKGLPMASHFCGCCES